MLNSPVGAVARRLRQQLVGELAKLRIKMSAHRTSRSSAWRWPATSSTSAFHARLRRRQPGDHALAPARPCACPRSGQRTSIGRAGADRGQPAGQSPTARPFGFPAALAAQAGSRSARLERRQPPAAPSRADLSAHATLPGRSASAERGQVAEAAELVLVGGRQLRSRAGPGRSSRSAAGPQRAVVGARRTRPARARIAAALEQPQRGRASRRKRARANDTAGAVAATRPG